MEIQEGVYIASDAELILGDTEFISKAAKLLAKKIRSSRIDLVLTAEAKSIALSYEISRQLGLGRFVVARKSPKAYMGDFFAQKVRSITTESEQQLLLTRDELKLLSGRRICLLDDVVSTGSTFRALEAIVDEAGGEVVCRAAIWKEGPWDTGEDLAFLGLLPVFLEDGVSLAGQSRPK